MTVKLSPIGNDAPFVDASGVPLNGGLLYTYVGGSVSTAQTTYQDSAGATPNANPIVLDSNGYPSSGGNVVSTWLTSGVTYKFVLKTSAGVTVWSRDNISGINDTTITLDRWISGPAPTYVSATSFTLVGDQTSTFEVGRRTKTTNSGGTIYSTITASAYAAATTVTVANDSGTLDSGLSAVSYSLETAVSPSIDADMVNRKGTAVASAATTNIWGIVGDYIHITGSTGPITSLGTAPYAGAQRTVIFDNTPTLTHNATTLSLPGAANIVAAAGDRMVVRADTTANMIVVSFIPAAIIPIGKKQPTRQVFTSGAGATYTTPANATRINVRLVGGGAGGGAATANGGVSGNATTFSTLTGAAGIGGGTNGAPGGVGGAASGGDINIPGGSGQGGSGGGAGGTGPGGQGGSSAFGGAGGGGNNTGAGLNAATNSGSGGGGGAGGYVEKLITAPAATYTYTVGASVAGGAAGTLAGGTGGAGIIIVDEYYD